MDQNSTTLYTQITPQVPTQPEKPKNRTLYDAGAFEIFWKNFLAGISKTLGMVFIQLLFFITIAYITMQYFYPIISPMLEKAMTAFDAVSKMQQLSVPSQLQLPENIKSLLNQSPQ